MLISGIGWAGSGADFDPGKTVPLPAGTPAVKPAKGVHFDGAKSEQPTTLVWSEGPTTSTPFTAVPAKKE